MRKIKIYILAIITAGVGLISLNSCDVANITELNFQIPLNFYAQFNNRVLPDSSIDFTNLFEYAEYRDNEDEIEDAEILHFNYWIRELDFRDGLNPDSIEFERIAFFIEFLNASGNRIPGERYLLGEYNDVIIGDFIRTARHIEPVDGAVGEQIALAVQEYPRFNIITNYTDIKGAENAIIDRLDARFDMTLRFTAKLD